MRTQTIRRMAGAMLLFWIAVFALLTTAASAQQAGDTLAAKPITLVRYTSSYVYYRVQGDSVDRRMTRETFANMQWSKVTGIVPPPDSVVTPPDTVTPPPPSNNGMYFNSAEPGCGTDPNVLLCDDFEDGDWYTKNCDVANASGGLLQTDGWCGWIYNDALMQQGTVRCGGEGYRSLCAATTRMIPGPEKYSGNMADHALAQPVDEVWVRFYLKALPFYSFGAEKMLTFNDGNPGDGGIRWGNLAWNCSAGNSSAGTITMGFPQPMDVCQTQNVGNNITIVPGNWYFFEAHLKLSAPGQANGVFELWVDNCLPACPAVPTLRTRMTNVRSNRTSTSQLIRVLWFESWSNGPISKGERFWDQVKVSKAGPIGFMK